MPSGSSAREKILYIAAQMTGAITGDTFAGIAPAGIPAFIAAQLAGMAVAVFIGRWFWTAD